ncbi:MAG: hypothetical protein J2O46_06875 [Nocardioides sp.]|nr:hypothetical protein [Nocardioides sp.]
MARHTLFHRDERTEAPAEADATQTRPMETAPYAGPVDRTDGSDQVGRTDRVDRDGRRAAVRDTYGGTNWGACFFGWLDAVGVTVLLAAVVSAVAAAVGANLNWTTSDARDKAGELGLAAAIALAVIVFIGYYAGGYVAGRMSRFDGALQGLGVWAVGLVVMILVAVASAVWGSSYDISNRLNLPSMDISQHQLGWGAAVTGVVLLVVMLLGALLGSAVGRRYHARIDRIGQ